MQLKTLVLFYAIVAVLAATVAAEDPAEATPAAGKSATQDVQAMAGGAWKSWTWGELHRGDCHQINGVLMIYKDDGKFDFTAKTWTDSTWSGDIWHAYFRFKDSNGGLIGTTATYDSPVMHRTGVFPGGGSKQYDMIVHGNYDSAARFDDIAGVDQWAKC